MTRRERLSLMWLGIFVALVAFVALARGEEHKHPHVDEALHQGFYANWWQPDYPDRSCCNKSDCYPTMIKRVGGTWFALKRDVDEDKGYEYSLRDPELADSWHPIPEDKIEHNQVPGRPHPTSGKPMREPRESPDTRSHVCMKNTAGRVSSKQETWFVFCAVLVDLI